MTGAMPEKQSFYSQTPDCSAGFGRHSGGLNNQGRSHPRAPNGQANTVGQPLRPRSRSCCLFCLAVRPDFRSLQ